MNSSHSSRLLLVIVGLVVSAGVVAGVSVTDQQSPTEAAVDSRIEATFTLTELYQEPSTEQWQLQGETELRNVTWTFHLVDQAGNVQATNSDDGQTANQTVSLADRTDEVRVTVVGRTPVVENFTYDPAPTFLVAGFTHAREGGASTTLETYEARHYTEESQEARDAIESARSAIDAAGGNAEAEETLGNAVSAYEGENFDNAVSLARQAERRADRAQQTAQRNRLILYAVAAIVVVAVLLGLVLWWRSRGPTSRL